MNTLKYKFIKNNILVIFITTALLIVFAVLSLLFLRIEDLNGSNAGIWNDALAESQDSENNLLVHTYIGIFLVVIFTLLISVVLSFVLARSLFKSLKELNRASRDILEDKLDLAVMLPAEEELKDIAQNLESLRLKLKKRQDDDIRLENERNMVMASLSHDMKTPITSIKGYLEGINDGLAKDEKTLKRYLEIISAKSRLLERLAENMSDYSELGLGRMRFSFKYLDFSELVESFCSDWRMEMTEQKRSLVVDITEKELSVAGDELKLKRVFDNLVLNAIKYSKEDSEILVKLQGAERGALLVVSDNGKGIKTEDLRKVFDGFFRGDAARSNVSGNGLGLAIAKQIVENHHGKIWIRSEQNVGTQVYIYLPIRKRGETGQI